MTGRRCVTSGWRRSATRPTPSRRHTPSSRSLTAYTLDPVAGTWTLIVDFAEPGQGDVEKRARAEAVAAGLAGGYQEEPGTVGLISMFVRPQARGRGVGEALIAAVIDWAGPRDAKSVRLWVTETNKPARMLYERCGFSPTGERQPLPSKPHLSEIAMTRLL